MPKLKKGEGFEVNSGNIEKVIADTQKALKHQGRLPKFKNEIELNNAILGYFKKCEETKEIANKAGLCLFLHISRDTYSEYRKRYPDTVKGCDFAIENVWVQRLAGTTPTGAIFYLKNAFKEHYKDRTETDITSGGKKIVPILGGLSTKKK